MTLLGGVSIIYNMNTTRIRTSIIYNIHSPYYSFIYKTLLDRTTIIYNEHY
jgi:hypothetical protein